MVPGVTLITSGLKQLFVCEQFGLEPAPAEMFTVVPDSCAKAGGDIARIATRVKTPNNIPVGFDIMTPYGDNQLINSVKSMNLILLTCV